MLNAAPVANDDAYTILEDTVLSASPDSLPANVTPIRWSENGHYYAHVPAITSSWHSAETAAANMRYLGSQGHLLTMTTAAEEAFILSSVINHLPRDSRVYAGLTDRDIEGTWKWVTGEPDSHTNWRPTEPTMSANNNEDYMAMYFFPQGWLWGDIPESGFPASYIVEFDGPFNGGLLVNDTDADSDPLTAALVDGPDHGKLDLKSNGSFTYTPDADFSGVDTFTYKANDGQADSNVAKVTINVTPNTAPVAKNDAFTVGEDTVLKAGEMNLPAGAVPKQWSANGHYYLHVPALTSSWRGAETTAANMRYFGSPGHLLTITSAAEEAFILGNVINHLPRDSRVYAGLTDREAEGTWEWVTGEPTTYTHWNPGEPTPGDNDEDYMAMAFFPSGWMWGDLPDNGIHSGSYIVEFDGPFVDSLLANDSDAENDTLTAVVVAQPQNGALDLKANGTFTYTPNGGFVGADSFTYKLNDGDFDSNVATVTISVTPVNDAPVASPERYLTGQNQPLTVTPAQGVLANDVDVEGDSLSAVLVTGPGKGQLTLAANGSFTYTPNTGYFGPDSFTYQASDGKSSSETTTVSLFVTNPDNVAPQAQNDSYTTPEDTVLRVSGDNLPGGVVPIRWSENGHYYAHVPSSIHWLDAEAAAAKMSFLGATGHLVTITSAAEEEFLTSGLLSNWVENPVFIGLTDRAVEGDFRWITGEPLTYTNWNAGEPDDVGPGQDYSHLGRYPDGKWRWSDVWDSPHFGSYLVEFDAPLSGAILKNDSDANKDPMTALLVSPPQHGTLVLNPDGTLAYTPASNYNGPDSFTYKANDGQFDSNIATVNITVTPVNDSPTVVADKYTVAEDSKLTVAPALGVLANDSDPEGNSFTGVLVDAPKKGQLTLNPDGSFTYVPNANFFGVDSFAYRAADANSSPPATVTIQVANVNDAPVAVNDTISAVEDTPITVVGSVPTGFTPVQWSANGHYYAQVRGDINWPNAVSASQALRFRGSRGHLVTVGSDAEHQFLVASVLTGHAQRYWIGLTDEGTEGNFRWVTGETLTYTNWGGGRPDNAGGNEHYVEVVHDSGTPFWRWNDIHASFGTNGYIVEFEGPFRHGVLENDQEADNDPLTAQLVTGSTNGTLTLNTDGTFTYTPNANFAGSDSFTYKASDGQLESNVAMVTINVAAANDPPVGVPDAYHVASTLTVSGAQGVLANDVDIDSPRASLTAQLLAAPTRGTLTLNPNGSFTYTRGPNFTSGDSFTYRTSDGTSTSDLVTVTISPAIRLRTENVTIVSKPLEPVEGFFDVYVDVAPGFSFNVAGYDVALRSAGDDGVTLLSAARPSSAHPALFTTEPTFVASFGSLRVTDALETGAAPLDNGDGLFRVRFRVAPDIVSEVPISFTALFTNLADENGQPLPIDRAGGAIAITELAAPKVAEVLVRGSDWTPEFLGALHPQGLGYPVPAGQAQLADLPWRNIDQIVVRFNEHVDVDREDLIVRGVNTATYAITGFNYDPATFTARWTFQAPLAADKLRIDLAGDGLDPIRNANNVRLDGNWTDGGAAFPSGNGRSGGNFLFRMDILPGNVDQEGPTNVLDTIKTRNRQFTSVGDANYSPLFDVNGSGRIDIFDTVQVRNLQFTDLPAGQPGSAGSPAAAPSPAPAITATRRIARPLDARLVAEVYRLMGAADDQSGWHERRALLGRKLFR
jgi:VCBS repeat-containing protein